jgi:hypothetical protein
MLTREQYLTRAAQVLRAAVAVRDPLKREKLLKALGSYIALARYAADEQSRRAGRTAVQ